jgi:HlyD family secretion protein
MHKIPRFAPVAVMLVLTVIFAVFLATRASGANGALTASGTIEADEIIIAPETNGRISEVLVEEGASVQAGDTLVKLDSSLLDAQTAQAKAVAEAASAGARAAQANLDLLKAGSSAEQQAVARAGVFQAQVNVDAAQQNYDDLTAAQQDTAAGKAIKQQLDRTKATLVGAQAQYTLAKAGPRTEQIKAASEQAVAAQAQADAAAAALALLDVQRNKLSLVAPTAGMILERAAQPGEFAAPGAALLVLGRTDHLTLTVYVPEDRYGQVSVGQKVSVRADSFSDEVFEAEVAHIAERAEFTPRNVQTTASRKTTVFAVKLVLAGTDGRLKPGMPADVEFK